MGLAILLALISVSGLIGTYEHFESRSEEGQEAACPALVQRAAGKAGRCDEYDRCLPAGRSRAYGDARRWRRWRGRRSR